MRYLEFQRYLELKGRGDLNSFERNIGRACAVVNNLTFGRIKELDKIPIEVELVCRDITDLISSEASVNVVSKSHAAGAVSESISYSAKSEEERQKDIMRIVYDYLANITTPDGVPLLYKGAMR